MAWSPSSGIFPTGEISMRNIRDGFVEAGYTFGTSFSMNDFSGKKLYDPISWEEMIVGSGGMKDMETFKGKYFLNLGPKVFSYDSTNNPSGPIGVPQGRSPIGLGIDVYSGGSGGGGGGGQDNEANIPGGNGGRGNTVEGHIRNNWGPGKVVTVSININYYGAGGQGGLGGFSRVPGSTQYNPTAGEPGLPGTATSVTYTINVTGDPNLSNYTQTITAPPQGLEAQSGGGGDRAMSNPPASTVYSGPFRNIPYGRGGEGGAGYIPGLTDGDTRNAKKGADGGRGGVVVTWYYI